MTNLIGFDKNRGNLEFKGPCKLSVNFMSNYLYIEPKNEEFKLISASFEWNYVMKKNLLFVFAEFDFLDFCLEFKNEQMCKKILDYIMSGKKNHGIADSISIDDGFINPIFQKIADYPTVHSELINVIAKWHQLLDEEDKKKYSNLMKDYGIHDTIYNAVQNEASKKEELNLEETKNRKRKFNEIKKEKISQDEMEKKVKPSKRFSKIIPSTQFQLIYIRYLRHQILLIYTSDQLDSFHEYKSKSKSDDKFKCVTCEKKAFIDIEEDGEICVKMESKEHSCKPSKKLPENSKKIKLIQKPNYEHFDNCPGKVSRKLVIFNSDDRSLCYEYFWYNAKSKFFCHGCCLKRTANSVISNANIRNEGTEKEYVEIINSNHQCEKRKYSSEKYEPIYDYVLKPDFKIQKFNRNGKERQKLIIYDKNDRRKCHEYYYHSVIKKFHCVGCTKDNKLVTATLNRNSEGDEYIILSNAQHVCEMRTSKTFDNIILHQPQDFEIIGESKNLKIFVFENNDQKNGYQFSKNTNSFLCLGCRRMSKKNYQNVSIVRGKLLKNEETDQYSFEMKPNQIHICEPRPYQPEKYEDIPKTSDFFYYRLKNEPKTVKVAIRSSENNQLYFAFSYQKANNYFICIECRRMKKSYTIKLQKDDNGKEYFNHCVKKHICKPIKVSAIPKSDILKEAGISFESKPKIKIDESKVIKSPNFELRPNKFGVPERRLIILCSNDENLCYEFCYDVSLKFFYCNKCKTKKTYVSAKLHKNESSEEPFIVMGKNQHVCQPTKYLPK